MITRELNKNPVGTNLSRWLISLVEAKGNAEDAARRVAKYDDSPTVAATLRAFHQKSAVAPATTFDGPWAGALTAYGISSEVWQLLQSASIFGRLVPGFRRVPFRTKVSRELGTGAGSAWVGESLPTPVTPLSYDMFELGFAIRATIAILTQAEFRFSPIAEAGVRNSLIAAITRDIDRQLLDPSVAATGANPASLTHDATSITSSGTSAANMLADLESLIAAIETAGETLTWCMRKTSFGRIAAKLASVGLTISGNTLLGIPVVAGSTAPAGQVTLIDGASIAVAYDEGIDLDLTVEGDCECKDSDLSSSGTTMVSLYQNALVGIKASRAVTWAPAVVRAGSPSQPAGVAYMSGLPY